MPAALPSRSGWPPAFLLRWLVAGLSLLLAACETHTTTRPPAGSSRPRPATPPTTEATAPMPPAPLAPPPAPPESSDGPHWLKSEPGQLPYQMQRGSSVAYHRYVGQLGTRPVVVELFMGLDEAGELREHTLMGSYYDARRGGRNTFSSQYFHPRRRLRLVASTEDDVPECWQAQQPQGAWLTGTVIVKGRPARRFTLREDYHAAVPLVIRSAQMYGRRLLTGQGDRNEKRPFTGSYSLRYVQLLGSAAHRPALQRLLPSRPAQVRARLRHEFEEGEATLCNIEDYRFSLNLNDYGILSYRKEVSDYMAGSAHPNDRAESLSCDLHTGRRITLAHLLRPGSKPALVRLALRYMDAQYRKDIEDWNKSPEAPADYLGAMDLAESFDGLTPDGLLLNADIGPHVMGSTTITIPYAALRPLLRPRTPLNRVLVARGLPPVL